MCTGLLIASPGVAMADDGESTYKLVCSSCHESGIRDAPKLKDKAVWIPRISMGMDTLYASTLNGKCKWFVTDFRKDLSDEVIKDAVDYMISEIKKPDPFQTN